MGRSWLVGVSAVSLLAVMTGCTPPPAEMAAITQNRDGDVRVLIFVCKETKPAAIAIYDRDNEQGWTINAPVDVTPFPEPSMLSFVAFGPADGWLITESSLSQLSDGRRYGLSAQSGRHHVSFNFTIKDLDRAKNGVLTGSRDSLKAMSEGDFKKQAEERCNSRD